MISSEFFLRMKPKAIVLVAISFVCSSPLVQVQAQNETTSSPLRYVPPVLPDRGLTSGRQRGAASRGQCGAEQQPLTALVPATKETLRQQKENLALNTYESVFGETISSSPTLWFFNPYTLTAKLPLEFVLEDAGGNLVYKSTFTASGTKPGFVSFRFPPKVAVLGVGKKYHWYFSINCDADAPAYVHGWIQRVVLNPSLRSQVQKASARQRVAIYAKNGIWHEALSTSGQLRSANPQDPTLLRDWDSLLYSIGLGAIAHQPISAAFQGTTQAPDKITLERTVFTKKSRNTQLLR